MDFTLLISAYSINPYRALDDGIAWNILLALDQKFRLLVVTHPANRNDIERFLSESPSGADIQAQFVYYAPLLVPGAGHTTPPRTLLHKYLWHWGVVSFIRRRNLQFDIAHHLSFPCGWCPSFLWRLGKPFIWGPVGYPPFVPSAFLQPYGGMAKIKDRLCWGLKRALWKLDPFVEISARKAAHIFVVNREVIRELNLSRNRTTVIPAVATHACQKRPPVTNAFRVLSIGAFIPLAGFDVAIRAFAAFCREYDASTQPHPELIIIGKGPGRRRIERMSRTTGLPPDRIRIVESEDPALIDQYLSSAQVYFSPTHDHIDQLLPPALAHSLPVICFDRRENNSLVSDECGLRVAYGSYDECVQGFASHLLHLYKNPGLLQQLSIGARKKFERQLTWAHRGDAIAEAYWNVFHRHALWKLTEADIA